jgi:hypothetical protein
MPLVGVCAPVFFGVAQRTRRQLSAKETAIRTKWAEGWLRSSTGFEATSGEMVALRG